MNEQASALKFLFWVGAIALACSGTVSLTKATYHMAEAAVSAQSHDRLSYGQYSRMLWSGRATKPRARKKAR
jgi:hypothetical protein